MENQNNTYSRPTADINHVVLVGRAGRDPEMRYFESGKVVTSFSLAVNRPMKDAQTDWFDIEIWGKPAEIAGEYVKKGSLIGVEGKIRWDSWISKETGETNIKPMVIADNIRLLGSKKDNNAAAVPQTSEVVS
ncbi:MAG: single-stranded DNA-binding protein [Candidatus Melainabacteria bacterium]|nr:single-stranded DNA-binding protein [Candidatus Melainabacteria bacterium]